MVWESKIDSGKSKLAIDTTKESDVYRSSLRLAGFSTQSCGTVAVGFVACDHSDRMEASAKDLPEIEYESSETNHTQNIDHSSLIDGSSGDAAVVDSRAEESIGEESSDEEVLSLDDVTSKLVVLQSCLANARARLLKRNADLVSIEQCFRADLADALLLISERIPSFGDDLDGPLRRFAADARALAEALAFQAGQRVVVDYEEAGVLRSYYGTVKGVEDALRTDEAEIRVRFDDDGIEYSVLLADGGLVPH